MEAKTFDWLVENNYKMTITPSIEVGYLIDVLITDIHLNYPVTGWAVESMKEFYEHLVDDGYVTSDGGV